jgi:hypothetical protein
MLLELKPAIRAIQQHAFRVFTSLTGTTINHVTTLKDNVIFIRLLIKFEMIEWR